MGGEQIISVTIRKESASSYLFYQPKETDVPRKRS
jgi:hypothetical protein